MASWNTVGWWPTTNTHLAAALSVIGLLVRTEAQLDERTGTETRRLFLSLEPADKAQRDRLTPEFTRTRAIVRMIQDGTLEKRQPLHPTLCGLAALTNRRAIITWMKTGTPHRLVPVGPGQLHTLQPTDQAPAETARFLSAPAYVRVHEITVAAALATIGVPILRILGQPENQTIDLAADSPSARAHMADQTTTQILQDYRARETPPETAFFSAVQTLWNYHAIQKALAKEIPTILLRKPRSKMAAVIRPDITGKGLDLVHKAFTGG